MGAASLIRLVFWVKLGPIPWYVVGYGGPRPRGHQLVGIASWAGPVVHSKVMSTG